MSRAQTIICEDPLQRGYEYTLTKAIGKNFDSEFKPQLTPKELIELGVFGGAYFEKHIQEYPKTWFTNANLSKEKNKTLNFFKVNASQSREEWTRKGWIYSNDPRGWFQWYFRYYLGRRIPEEDKRQICRWKNMTRHVSQVQKYCSKGDYSCRPTQRQALLHWAYDSRKM
jgi:hypothetical protein